MASRPDDDGVVLSPDAPVAVPPMPGGDEPPAPVPMPGDDGVIGPGPTPESR